ncbi:hypothetical protein [Candidatus Vidania fulgoroideorum]
MIKGIFFKKKKRRIILGRGNSTKKGNTCGRGNKGQKSRSGYSKKNFFSGGQTRFNLCFPKFGFKKIKKKKKSFKLNKNIFYIKSKSYQKLYCNILLKPQKIFYVYFKYSLLFKKQTEFLGGCCK